MDKTKAKWPGGYIRQGKKHPTFVIERWVGGDHFHVSTRCQNLRSAMKQLERFEENPRAYRPEGNEQRSGLAITDKLVEGYLEYMLKERKNSVEWSKAIVGHLGDWSDDLDGKDLRDVTLAELKEALSKRKSRRHRIEAIKAFCTWLRREKGLLIAREDPTIDLPVPQAKPEKHKRRKAVHELDIRALMPFLPETTREVLQLQSFTAWHISECRRFAAGGEVLDVPSGVVTAPGRQRPLAVLATPHKSGDPTRTPVLREEDLALARLIRSRGRIPGKSTLADHMRAACKKVIAKQAAEGLPEEKWMKQWRLGMMRHTTLTWAVENGATPQEASEFAGHKSLSTTRRFYLDTTIPTVSVPVLRLVTS